MSHGYGVTEKKVLLCGYFGYGNMGDEAALDAAVRYLIKRGISVTVAYSSAGDFIEYTSLGAVKCKRFSLHSMLKAIDECDALIFSGGNHFENESSRRSLLYYSCLALTAERRGKPTLMLASGLGRMRLGIDRAIARAALAKFSFAGLRTIGDIREGQELLGCRIVSMPDLALSLPVISEKKERSFAIIPRRNSAIMLDSAIALRELGLVPVVIPLFIDEDATAARGFGEALGCEVFVSQNTSELRHRIAGMRIVLTERLHGAVFSLTASTPFMMKSEAEKCVRFTDEVETRAKKLNTPSPFIKNLGEFGAYILGEATDFSALCSDFSSELLSALEYAMSACKLI